MLKFQDDYTTIVTNFEDFILFVYVLIDDLCKQFVPESVSHRRNFRSFKKNGADYGKCPSKKETCFGFKVPALITLEGYITAFETTPASIDDREGLKDLTEDISGFTVPGDKGYAGKIYTRLCRRKVSALWL